MFDASFSIYECQTTKALLTRTLNYSLPVSLKGTCLVVIDVPHSYLRKTYIQVWLTLFIR